MAVGKKRKYNSALIFSRFLTAPVAGIVRGHGDICMAGRVLIHHFPPPPASTSPSAPLKIEKKTLFSFASLNEVDKALGTPN